MKDEIAKRPERKPGRPKGSPNKEVRVVTTPATRCPRCGSTERDRYYRTTERAHAGTGPDGQPYTRIVRRWTRCAQCGQHRVDRILLHPDATIPPDGEERDSGISTA